MLNDLVRLTEWITALFTHGLFTLIYVSSLQFNFNTGRFHRFSWKKVCLLLQDGIVWFVVWLIVQFHSFVVWFTSFNRFIWFICWKVLLNARVLPVFISYDKIGSGLDSRWKKNRARIEKEDGNDNNCKEKGENRQRNKMGGWQMNSTHITLSITNQSFRNNYTFEFRPGSTVSRSDVERPLLDSGTYTGFSV